MNARVLGAATMLPLAIGAASNIAAAPGSSTRSSHKAKACVVRLGDCPDPGCAGDGTPESLTNILKRTIPTGATPELLSVADFATLQTLAESRVGTKKAFLTAAQHTKLRGITLHGHPVSEGDLVEVTGFVVGDPHFNTGESVNCNLPGQGNNDLHITISDHPGADPSDEMQGFVVEMIPQNRPAQWTRENVEAVASAKTQVLVIGQLFYDSKHLVNDDPDNPLTSDPRRMSLFEIHPITKFLVCVQGKGCDPRQPGDWKEL